MPITTNNALSFVQGRGIQPPQGITPGSAQYNQWAQEYLSNAVNAGDPAALQAAGYGAGAGAAAGQPAGQASGSWVGQRKPTPAELTALAKEQGWSEDFARFEPRQLSKWIQDNWDVQAGKFRNDFGDLVEKPTEAGPKSIAAGYLTGEGAQHGGFRAPRFGGGGAPQQGAAPTTQPSAYGALEDPLQAQLFQLFQDRGGFAGQIGANTAQSLGQGGVWSWAGASQPNTAAPAASAATKPANAWSPQNVMATVQNAVQPPAPTAAPAPTTQSPLAMGLSGKQFAPRPQSNWWRHNIA